jgi:uncharacterized protein YceK
MPRGVLVLLVVVLPSATSGCGTFMNTIWLAPFEGGERVYGGVRLDAEAGPKFITDTFLSDKQLGQQTTVQERIWQALGGCVLVMDLPVSFVGDTLTLPWMLPAALERALKVSDAPPAETAEEQPGSEARLAPTVPAQEGEASAAAAVALMGGVSPTAEAAPPASVSSEDAAVWEEVTKIAVRLKGRVLGCLIQKGMTKEDVERILGKDYLLSGGCLACCVFWDLTYFDLGLGVHLSAHNDDHYRVDNIHFWDLFAGI